jgi:hypothetical protein
MASAQLRAMFRHIRNLAADQMMSKQMDGALLRAFVSRNDQPAFGSAVVAWIYGCARLSAHPWHELGYRARRAKLPGLQPRRARLPGLVGG